MKTTKTVSENTVRNSHKTDASVPADAAAFEEMKPEFDAMESGSLVAVNADPGAAVQVVLGHESELKALVPEIEKHAPTFDSGEIKRIGTYALALSYADARFAFASQPAEDLPALDAKAEKMEAVLIPALQLAVNSGALTGVALGDMPTGHGYRNRLFRVQSIAVAFRDNWSQLEGKLPFGREYLDEVEAHAVKFTQAMGVREHTDPKLIAATRDRQAAFTKLFTTWDRIRHVVQYVCADAIEAERIAPSIYVRSAPTRSKGEAPAGNDATATTPAMPTAAPTTPRSFAMPGVDKDGNPIVVAPLSSNGDGSQKLGGSPFAR